MLLALLLLVPDWPRLESAEFPPAAQQAALAATVRVVPSGRVGIGSGVAVGRHDGKVYILTAQHLLKDPRVEVEWFTAESYPKPAGSAGPRLVEEWEELDLAVLTIPAKDVPVGVLPLAPRDAGDTEQFPALTVGCDRGDPPTCRPMTVRGKALVRNRKPGEVNRFFWETAEAPALGRSGGPLLDRDGRLLGVCSASQDGRGYFVHLSEIRHALKEKRYDWLLGEPAKPK